jgi:hypothetical protein
MELRLRTSQQRGSDLRRAGAEQQSRGDAAPVGDATCGNHRNLDGVDDRGNERKQSHQLPLGFRRIEATAMSTRFHPLTTTTSASASSAARASATVDTLANQAMPDRFSLATNSGG